MEAAAFCPFRVAATGTFLDSTALSTLTLTTYQSQLFVTADEIKLIDPFNNAAPNLKPQATSPALTKAAKFDAGTLTDAFFDKVTFIGAMDATNDWTAQWAVWGK